MKIISFKYFLLALMILLTSCTGKPEQTPEKMTKLDNLESATDEQISAFAVGHPLSKVQESLHLEKYEHNIAPGGAFGFPTYRYYIKKRLLFLDTDTSGKITRAYFVERVDKKPNGPRKDTDVGGTVVKPK